MTSVLITESNLNSGLINKHKSVIFGNSHWHKITIDNVEGLKRDTVLSNLMKFCHPLHFIPVCYETSNNRASFLMKNCGPAIERLFDCNLSVPNPLKNRAFKLTIELCFANANDLKINIQDNVVNVLKKKFNSTTGLLNLENFGNDSELEEYCPLSQPKLLFYILHLARSLDFKSLKLSANDIESLKPLEALQGLKLTTMDLRLNSIKSVSELSSLKDLNIKELWLDGNPLCDNYNDINYIKAVTGQLGTLEKLDGVPLQIKGFLSFRRNFLCNQSGYDLVDQFLEHYFTLYDANNRLVLDGIYHKNALFSLTSTFIPQQSTSQGAKLIIYNKVSRNLHQTSQTKYAEFLYSGSPAILKLLTTFPPSEHDPYSFTVDLISHTEKTAVIVVCGVFREIAESVLDPDRLLGFTRTFVLLAGPNGEYSIVNEMVHIANATTSQATRAFKQVKIPSADVIYIPQPQNDKEKLEMAETVKAITGLNLEWSRKCLEECKFDLKKTLMLFVDLFKIDKIPSSAFHSSSNGKGVNIDIRAILSQSHQYGPTQQVNQTAPSTPKVGNVTNINRPTVQPANKVNPTNPSRHVATPIRNVPPVPRQMMPPVQRQMMPPVPRQMMPPMGGIQRINHPIMGNIQAIIPPRPIIHPMGNLQNLQHQQHQQQVFNPFNKNKNARVSLVNIQLGK